MYVQAYVQIYVHRYMHKHAHTSMHAYMHMYILTHIHTYINMHANFVYKTYTCAMQLYMHTCTCEYVLTCTHRCIYVATYKHTH